MDNLTATGTTTIDDEPAIVYELAASSSTNEIGIQKIRIVIGTNGTLYRFDIKSQIPAGDSGMKVNHLHFSFEPGDVEVQEPEWTERAT